MAEITTKYYDNGELMEIRSGMEILYLNPREYGDISFWNLSERMLLEAAITYLQEKNCWNRELDQAAFRSQTKAAAYGKDKTGRYIAAVKELLKSTEYDAQRAELEELLKLETNDALGILMQDLLVKNPQTKAYGKYNLFHSQPERIRLMTAQGLLLYLKKHSATKKPETAKVKALGSSWTNAAVKEINRQRKTAGVDALKADSAAQRKAQAWAENLAKRKAVQHGSSGYAESIIASCSSGKGAGSAAVTHNKDLLNDYATVIGVGAAKNGQFNITVVYFT